MFLIMPANPMERPKKNNKMIPLTSVSFFKMICKMVSLEMILLYLNSSKTIKVKVKSLLSSKYYNISLSFKALYLLYYWITGLLVQ